MKALVVANLAKRQAKELAPKVVKFLQDKEVHVFAIKDQAKTLNLSPFSQSDKVDFIISLGGDGYILRIIHDFPALVAPILGINLGSLGFLADIPVDSTFEALASVIDGKYQVQKRLMLEGRTANGNSCLSVNEMVVHRGKNHCLVDLALYVDGKYLNTFSADGVIVATPSGSTAYSLSAGGPILTPDLEAVVITPICPHVMAHRPIVLSMPQTIEIRYLSNAPAVDITFDGNCIFGLESSQNFTITRAKRSFCLITLEHIDYFSTLRTKLGWTGSLKSG